MILGGVPGWSTVRSPEMGQPPRRRKCVPCPKGAAPRTEDAQSSVAVSDVGLDGANNF